MATEIFIACTFLNFSACSCEAMCVKHNAMRIVNLLQFFLFVLHSSELKFKPFVSIYLETAKNLLCLRYRFKLKISSKHSIHFLHVVFFIALIYFISIIHFVFHTNLQQSLNLTSCNKDVS